MKNFLDENFLLNNPISVKLYHEFAKDMPIIDYHCHIPPEQIAQNKKFKNITELWLSADHYKWRQMRANGVSEEFVTGSAPDYDKFLKFAETLEKAIGNPLYHWSHLELREYFGYTGTLNSKTAPEVWEICNKKLETMSALDMVNQSNVEFIGTTDDPIDDLKWHKEIEENSDIKVKVCPSFRPDKVTNIELATFNDYIKELEKVTNIKIATFADIKKAISLRIDHFDAHNCKASDHGLDYIPYEHFTEQEVDIILKNKLNSIEPSLIEVDKFKTAFLAFLASEYTKKGWVMQLHYGCKRNNNTVMFEKVGADTGFDCIGSIVRYEKISEFLNYIKMQNSLPKTIVYSLNPNDDTIIDTILACFGDNSEISGKIQHGSAWWFNDTKVGMINQLISLANNGLLGNFVGMLTDSRSFLSYTRHEYFRRILCELIGNWVYTGEYPCDYELLEKLIKDISYNNAKKYFG